MSAPRLRTLAFALSLAFALGCPKRTPLPKDQALTPEEARLRLEREGARRARMSALVRARMSGIEGLLAGTDVDVLVEVPAKVHLAVRSFFEQPMYVLATDGVWLTILDATGPSGPVFLEGPADGEALGGLLGMDVWPHDVVALFLGIAPAAGARPGKLVVEPREGTYTLALHEPQGRVSVVTARLDDDALVRWRAFDEGGAARFDMRYEALTEENLPFPRRWRFTVFAPEGERGVVFEARELVVNGDPFDPRVFSLKAPPSVPVRPLPRVGPPPATSAR